MPSARQRRNKTHDLHVIAYYYKDGTVYVGKPYSSYWTSNWIGKASSKAFRVRFNIRIKDTS
jgi:hypothetical protein